MKKLLSFIILLIIILIPIYFWFIKPDKIIPVKPEPVKINTQPYIDSVTKIVSNSSIKNNLIFSIIKNDSYIYNSADIKLYIKVDDYKNSEKIKKQILNFAESKNLKPIIKQNIIQLSYKNQIFLNIDFMYKPTFLCLIIDDVGYNFNILKNFIELDTEINFAVLPELKYTNKSMKFIKKNNNTLLLHLPMEPKNYSLIKKVKNQFILSSMNEKEIKNKLYYYLNKYPMIDGINNHMGSKVTADSRVMQIFMNSLSKYNKLNNKDYFFIDSFTNRKSVAFDYAKQSNIRTLQNQGFIDNKDDSEYIYSRLIKFFKESHNIPKIVIGHNRTQTYLAVKKIKESYLNKFYSFTSIEAIIDKLNITQKNTDKNIPLKYIHKND
jgi:hypothetical protein